MFAGRINKKNWVNYIKLQHKKIRNSLAVLNPLMHIGHYSVRMAKISILKYEGRIKKISYERRVY